MTKIEYRIHTRHVCWDGDPDTTHVLEIRCNGGIWGREGSRAECRTRRDASALMDAKLAQWGGVEGFEVGECDGVVSYSHRHIGQYGSPNRFRCTALDRR